MTTRPLEGQKHPTTRAHYEKYKALADQLHVSLASAADTFMGGATNIAEAYRDDQHLNTIPLKKWDGWAIALRAYQHTGISLAEGVCLYKHLALYELLGLVPEFTDEEDPDARV